MNLNSQTAFIFARRVNRARFLEEAKRFDAKARRLEDIKKTAQRRKVRPC